MTDEQIEDAFKRAGGKWSGDHWTMEDADLHPFVRALATPTDSAVNAGAVPSDEAEGLLELVKDALYNAYGKGALGDFARSKNEQAKALGIAQAMDKLTIDTLATLRAALAPKADSSEPRARSNSREYVAFLEREFGEGRGQDRASFTIGNVSRAFGAGWLAALASPSPASAQVDAIIEKIDAELDSFGRLWMAYGQLPPGFNYGSVKLHNEIQAKNEEILSHVRALSTAQPQADAGVSAPAFYVRDDEVAKLADKRIAARGTMLFKEPGEGRTGYVPVGISPAPKEGASE